MKNGCVFAAWAVIMRDEIVTGLVLVTLMAAREIITTCCMVLFELISRMTKGFLHGRGHQHMLTDRHPSRRQ